jgi:nitrogenase cofactor biosynthesis protein NifB
VIPRATIAAKIADHPCYSERAHDQYARMHVPVAPGCNIQCHYCNRKFDCANESRPGVTTSLLSPEAALARVGTVAAKMPQLRVVGVAGPGEPLANAARTFRTLALIGRRYPQLRLCLSTNGLALLEHVDRIVELGIDHVTITINMTDPEIGARIYPWITFRGRRYTGTRASRILSERQLEGLRALVDRQILCKVNSVLIPGVNDDHLVEVSRTVHKLGAVVHNVMPLASRPEYGTHYARTGQREPTPDEVAGVRARCEAATGDEMRLMRHCQRCRADAIGLLSEDRSGEFTESAAVAITLTDRAEDRVHSLLGEAGNPRGFGLRVGVESFGWTQRYQLSLGAGPASDETVVATGVGPVFVKTRDLPLVEGVRIDYVTRSDDCGFTFHNPSRDWLGPSGLEAASACSSCPTSSPRAVPPARQAPGSERSREAVTAGSPCRGC